MENRENGASFAEKSPRLDTQAVENPVESVNNPPKMQVPFRGFPVEKIKLTDV